MNLRTKPSTAMALEWHGEVEVPVPRVVVDEATGQKTTIHGEHDIIGYVHEFIDNDDMVRLAGQTLKVLVAGDQWAAVPLGYFIVKHPDGSLSIASPEQLVEHYEVLS